MSAIGPGDWVECIDASTRGASIWEPGGEIVVGQAYQVSDVFEGWNGAPNLALVGRDRGIAERFHGCRLGYAPDRFRSIYRPKSDFIESLKAPAPPAVRELIDA